MNIKKLNEKLTKVIEGMEEFDDQIYENKRIFRVYQKACEGLVMLMDALEDTANPSTGGLANDTQEFYNRLSNICEEINSRSIAFQA